MLLTTEREASKLMYGIRLSNMRERPPAGVAFSLHLEGDEWMVQEKKGRWLALLRKEPVLCIAIIHISEPTRQITISYSVFS